MFGVGGQRELGSSKSRRDDRRIEDFIPGELGLLPAGVSFVP
jgi:hypothetical protein